jgi:hypothetical protein
MKQQVMQRDKYEANNKYPQYVLPGQTKYKIVLVNTYLPELFKSIPPRVRFTSPLLCGDVL